MKKLVCLLKGHTASARRLANVSEHWTPMQMSHNPITGELRFIRPILTGISYVGKVATCERCGCDFDATFREELPTTPYKYPTCSKVDTYV